MKHKYRSGFTLVELMVVVVIIAILASIGLPAFARMRDTARYNAILANLRSVYTASQAYFADNPTASTVAYTALTSGNYITLTSVAGETYTGISISQAPTATTAISVTALSSFISNSSLRTVSYTYQ